MEGIELATKFVDSLIESVDSKFDRWSLLRSEMERIWIVQCDGMTFRGHEGASLVGVLSDAAEMANRPSVVAPRKPPEFRESDFSTQRVGTGWTTTCAVDGTNFFTQTKKAGLEGAARIVANQSRRRSEWDREMEERTGKKDPVEWEDYVLHGSAIAMSSSSCFLHEPDFRV